MKQGFAVFVLVAAGGSGCRTGAEIDAGPPPMNEGEPGAPDGGADASQPSGARDAGVTRDGPLGTFKADTRVAPDGAVKAFPTAEGFAAYTPGGRGGRVLHVINLKDSGVGSFRWAVQQRGPRIVVFDVSGTITATTGTINIGGKGGGNLTIAGQTSPGGIQIRGPQNSNVSFVGVVVGSGADDVVVRHLRVRSGGPSPAHTDGSLAAYGANGLIRNVIFDHNSIEWATHGALWAAGDTNGVTFSWNLIAAGVDFATAGLDTNPNGSAHHNLIVHSPYGIGNGGRYDGLTDWRNNIVYNWYYYGILWGNYAYNRSVVGNLVKNIFIAGPLKQRESYMYFLNGGPRRPDGQDAAAGGTRMYLEGNWGPNCKMGCADEWDHKPMDYDTASIAEQEFSDVPASAQRFRATKPYNMADAKVPFVPVTTYPNSELETALVPTVGASRPFRDAVDQLYVDDFVKRRPLDYKKLGNGGPWPDLAIGAPALLLDTDQDGMPDGWEMLHGLDPRDAADGPRFAKNGYTNVENYLNELAGDPIP